MRGLSVLLYHVVRHHGPALRDAVLLTWTELAGWVKLALPMILQLTLTLGTWSMFFFLVEQVGVMELKVSHIARNYFMLAFVVSQGIQQTTRTYISTCSGQDAKTSWAGSSSAYGWSTCAALC